MPRGNDARPAYQTKYHWTCCRCGFLNFWDTARQCVEFDCHHAYTDRCCTIRPYQVRVSVPRGTSSSSSRRS